MRSLNNKINKLIHYERRNALANIEYMNSTPSIGYTSPRKSLSPRKEELEKTRSRNFLQDKRKGLEIFFTQVAESSKPQNIAATYDPPTSVKELNLRKEIENRDKIRSLNFEYDLMEQKKKIEINKKIVLMKEMPESLFIREIKDKSYIPTTKPQANLFRKSYKPEGFRSTNKINKVEKPKLTKTLIITNHTNDPFDTIGSNSIMTNIKSYLTTFKVVKQTVKSQKTKHLSCDETRTHRKNKSVCVVNDIKNIINKVSATNEMIKVI